MGRLLPRICARCATHSSARACAAEVPPCPKGMCWRAPCCASCSGALCSNDFKGCAVASEQARVQGHALRDTHLHTPCAVLTVYKQRRWAPIALFPFSSTARGWL